jgi:aminopeptidase YwaD
VSSGEGAPRGERVRRASEYLDRLCLPYPDRHVGGPGNAAANRVFAEAAAQFGFEITETPFPCIVWEPGTGWIEVDGHTQQLCVGPYSLPVDVTASLVSVSSLEELRAVAAPGSVLVLSGELAREQLTPKNYPFYQWETHTNIVEAVEKAAPAVVISATGRDSELVGSLYPFPLIEDADFDIPHGFMTDVDGAVLLSRQGGPARVVIRSGRRASTATQLVARKGSSRRRLVISGHLDSRRGSPGAIDNATGVVILLLLAELLADYEGDLGIELVPFNGEDDYAAPGEVVYLAERGEGLKDEVVLNINVDGVGWRGRRAEVSLYECPEDVTAAARTELDGRDLVVEGDAWPQSDHMIFVMRGIPAIALTTADAAGLRRTIAHTGADVPAEVDPAVVVAAAEYVADLARRLAVA